MKQYYSVAPTFTCAQHFPKNCCSHLLAFKGDSCNQEVLWPEIPLLNSVHSSVEGGAGRSNFLLKVKLKPAAPFS